MLTRGTLALLAAVAVLRGSSYLPTFRAWLRGKPELTGTRTRIILEARSSPDK